MGDINVRIYTIAGFVREREITLDSLKERKKLIDSSIPTLEAELEEDRARLAELVEEKKKEEKLVVRQEPGKISRRRNNGRTR